MHFNGFNAELRRLESLSDCHDVIACLRSAFGDSYIKRELYIPERILELDQSGALHLYLARTESGETAAIIGWERVPMFPDTIEFCTLAVLPKFRGMRLGETMLGEMRRLTADIDCSSVFSYPIASHLKAQKAIGGIGAVCCGFYLNVFSTEKFFSGETGHKNPKDSLTIVVLPRDKTDAGTIFIREEYLPLAEYMYGELNVTFSADHTERPPEAPAAEYEYEYNDTHSTLYININSIGRNLPALIGEMCSRGGDPWFTVNLCLNINDPAAAYAERLLEESGFFPAGFHPLCGGREYMVFHFCGDTAFDIDDLDYLDGQKPFADYIRIKTKGNGTTHEK